MILVECPANYAEEKKYAIKALFSFMSDEPPEIETKNIQGEYRIMLENGKKIHLKDSFFSNLDGSIFNALIPEPSDVFFVDNRFVSDSRMPVLFGTEELEVGDDEIFIGYDIFASTFFMLTRWEEIINRKRDLFARFPGIESLAYKAGFLDRPVVNEYAIFLANIIKELGRDCSRSRKEFQFILTHDVDQVFYYPEIKRFIFRIIKGKYGLKEIMDTVFDRNPYWTFPFLMEQSEKRGLKSRFYFLSSSFTIHDNPLDYNHPKIKSLFAEIKAHGHEIGFHGSFEAYENLDMLTREKKRLEDAAQVSVSRGRQHYLRFSPQWTWKLWDQLGMKEDQTCGYADVEGFRCGTGDSFHAFDLLSRTQLDLIETPLLLMDGTLQDYRDMEHDVAIEKGRDIVAKCRKYKSSCTILFHNSSFTGKAWEGWDNVYEAILDS
ncbi:MAG: polysaccharide deacetylase family protein [Rectinemataceae bacterium]